VTVVDRRSGELADRGLAAAIPFDTAVIQGEHALRFAAPDGLVQLSHQLDILPRHALSIAPRPGRERVAVEGSGRLTLAS
jgi:hypothetical protein